MSKLNVFLSHGERFLNMQHFINRDLRHLRCKKKRSIINEVADGRVA